MTGNSFSVLNSSNVSDSSGSFPQTPMAASSPKADHHRSLYRTNDCKHQPVHSTASTNASWSAIKSLNISVINFWGIRSKLAKLHAFIEYYSPDVIIGTETKLKPDILDSEIFLYSYNVFRRDRISNDGGGVLIAVKSNIATTIHFVSTDCEKIWVEIHDQNSSFSMFVGCFYRAPGSPILKLHELGKSLEEIIQIAKNHTFILGGDFNLPGIDCDLWSDKSGETVMLRRWGSSIQKFGFINGVDNVN